LAQVVVVVQVQHRVTQSPLVAVVEVQDILPMELLILMVRFP
jgi:hypothetical protein